MPDFIPILTAAILSLIILIIVFGGWIFYPGHVFKEGSRTILLGENFEVIYTIGEEVVANLEGRTSRDFFSGEDKRVEFNVDKYTDVSEATIRLKTLDSNYYGNLIIALNGEEVYRGAPLGDKMITFDPAILERGNFLDVKAENSGWRLWAPTVYDFSLDMDVIYEGKKTQTFEFELSNEEVINAEYARFLIFGKREGTGHLIVSVNGEEVFSGYTTVQNNFAVDELKAGINKVELFTEPNTKYDITSAKVILFF
jgi:hypothetical protein